MKINIDIPEDEIVLMVRHAVQETVNGWIKESMDYRSSFRRHFEKEFREAVKGMIYEPELKQRIIDEAVEKAAFELRRKGMQKLLEEVGKR